MEKINVLRESIIKLKNNDPSVSITYTLEDVKNLFKEYGCTVVKCTKEPYHNCSVTFFRNNDRNTLLHARLWQFCEDPNYKFSKSQAKLIKPEDIIDHQTRVLESQRIEKEKKLRESMKAEDCELVSKYVKGDAKVFYLFNGFEYQTTPTKWNSGYRAHKSKCSHYTQNYIKKAFADEGCELISENKNVKTLLRYRYQGKIYEVTFDNWKNYGKRPHKYCAPVSEA